MRGRLRWEWATLLCVAISCGICAGQEQQWLQYRSAREVSLLGGRTGSVSLGPLVAERPAGVEMPQFKGATPLFAKWQTPMVKSGFLWIALDRSNKAGPYNLLCIDSNGNGRLDDETVATAYQIDQSSASFGPVKVVFQVEDGPVTYHLNFRFYNYNRERPELIAYSGGWYEGDITVGGAKKHCVLFDYDVNGTFDDRSPNAGACDRISIGDKTGPDASLVGRYIELDGVLYEPQIARDGAFVKLTKAENVKSGRVRLPTSITALQVGGENGSFMIKPKDGVGSLPVGTYRVLSWSTERTDDSGAKWQVNGRNVPEKVGGFEVAEGKDAELDIGEPFVASVGATTTAKTYNLRLVTAGRAGEQIELLRNGTRPQAPKVRIKNADGTYDRTFNFEYG
jgi:hypothetical protein